MKTNTPTHTPTPWTQDGLSIVSEHWSDIAIIDNGATDMDANVIPQDEAYANAAFIVRAVNSHFELLDTLKGITKAFKKLSEKYEPDHIDAEWLAHAIEAIANAEGGK